MCTTSLLAASSKKSSSGSTRSKSRYVLLKKVCSKAEVCFQGKVPSGVFFSANTMCVAASRTRLQPFFLLGKNTTQLAVPIYMQTLRRDLRDIVKASYVPTRWPSTEWDTYVSVTMPRDWSRRCGQRGKYLRSRKDVDLAIGEHAEKYVRTYAGKL